jgi:hypothetical protein
MIAVIKAITIFLMGIVLPVFILSSHPLYAREAFFHGYPVGELVVVKADVKAGTAIIKSPCGKTVTTTTGDVIGEEKVSITAIRKLVIEVESPLDNFGGKKTHAIPVIPIVFSIEEIGAQMMSKK